MLSSFRSLLVALVVLSTIQVSHSQIITPDGPPPLPKVVLAGEYAYTLGDPEKIAGPRITQVMPAPDGSFAYLVREIPNNPEADRARLSNPAYSLESPEHGFNDGKVQILVWNQKSGRVSVVWEAAVDSKTRLAVVFDHFIPGTGAILANAMRYSKEPDSFERIVLLATTDGLPARIIPADIDAFPIANPIRPNIVLYNLLTPTESKNGKKSWFQVLPLKGEAGPRINLSRNLALQGMFSEDGESLLSYEDKGEEESTKTRVWYSISLKDGSITELPRQPKRAKNPARLYMEQRESLPLQLETRPVTLQNPKQSLRAVYLKASDKAQIGEETSALISLDATPAVVMLDLSACLYLNRNGSLYAVPLRRSGSAFYLKTKHEREQAATMQIATMIGKVFQETIKAKRPLPPASDLKKVFEADDNTNPFKNIGMTVDDFVFLPLFQEGEKGNYANFTAPAKARLVLMKRPAGQAVIYADGHVEWETLTK